MTKEPKGVAVFENVVQWFGTCVEARRRDEENQPSLSTLTCRSALPGKLGRQSEFAGHGHFALLSRSSCSIILRT